MTYNDDDWNDPGDGRNDIGEVIVAAMLLTVIILAFIVLEVAR